MSADKLQPLQFRLGNPALLKLFPDHLRRWVLDRDGNVCRFCGFHSRKYQEVVFDGPHWWDMGEVFTTCIFCRQYFCISEVPYCRSGVVITFPQWTGAELNRLAGEIYMARIKSKLPSAKVNAQACLDFILKTRTVFSGDFQPGDPTALEAILKSAERGENSTILHDGLQNMRLFPLDRRIIREADLEFNHFPQISAFWRSQDGPFNIFGSASWIHRFCKEFIPDLIF